MEDLEPKIDLPGGSLGTTDAHEHLQTNGRTRRPVTAHDQANSELIGSEAVFDRRTKFPATHGGRAEIFRCIYNYARRHDARASRSVLFFLPYFVSQKEFI